MNKLNLIILLLAFAACIQTKAQDILIKNTNDSINCVIKEIGDDEIKYLTPEISETVIFGIDKNKVSKVIFANGNSMDFSNSMYDSDNYVSDKKNNIKIGFLSPLWNSTKISYERSIKPGRSIEATLGIIGLGWDTYDWDERGAFLKLGYKFIKSPDYYIKGQRFAHILKGAYIRPEIAISYYSYEDEDYYDTWIGESYYGSRETNVVFALMINIGKQWVFENGFVLDWFVGAGYGFGQNDNDHGFHKAFSGAVSDFPLAVTSGFRIGYNF